MQLAGLMMLSPEQLTWSAVPPIFQKGAELSILAGDPWQPGLFVARMKLPAGYTVAAHWHAADEHLTVISGTLLVGTGERFDRAAMKPLTAGAYVAFPAEMPHFLATESGAVVQATAIGPFVLHYVDPADDPAVQSSPTKS